MRRTNTHSISLGRRGERGENKVNKQIFLVLILVLMVSLVGAESIGNYEANKEMQITNYCAIGSCTYVNLTSIEYPNGTIVHSNTAMTKNEQTYNYSFTPVDLGTYFFTTCGDSTLDTCDKDSFFVNFNGEDNAIAAMIAILIFFVFLLVGYYKLNSKINYERWYEGLVTKYQDRNIVKLSLGSMAYNFMKSKATNYYFIGLFIMIVLTDIILVYNIDSLTMLFENLLMVYTLGIMIVGYYLLGEFIEFVIKLKDDALKTSWGHN